MKTTFTKLAITSIILLFSFVVKSKAQTYYNLYLCDNATATLHPVEPITPLVTGDKVHWFLDGNEILPAKEYDGTNASIDLIVPASLTVGLHKYTSAIENAGGCIGPQSNEFTVYKLPTKTLDLTKNRAAYCAEENNSIKDATITATTTLTPALPPLPDGIEYEYTWSATFKDKAADPAVSVNPITSIGQINGNEFKLNTKNAGIYEFTATVKYKLTAAAVAASSALKANDGCEVSQTATQIVTVTPIPTKPTITLN